MRPLSSRFHARPVRLPYGCAVSAVTLMFQKLPMVMLPFLPYSDITRLLFLDQLATTFQRKPLASWTGVMLASSSIPRFRISPEFTMLEVKPVAVEIATG